jgi:hypothetical protein
MRSSDSFWSWWHIQASRSSAQYSLGRAFQRETVEVSASSASQVAQRNAVGEVARSSSVDSGEWISRSERDLVGDVEPSVTSLTSQTEPTSWTVACCGTTRHGSVTRDAVFWPSMATTIADDSTATMSKAAGSKLCEERGQKVTTSVPRLRVSSAIQSICGTSRTA